MLNGRKLNGIRKRESAGIALAAGFLLGAGWFGAPEAIAAPEERRSPIVETIKAVKGKIGGTTAPAEPAPPPTGAGDPPKVILRLHGAPALGNSFIPKFATHLLEQRGHREVEAVKVGNEGVDYIGQGASNGKREAIEIRTFGVATGFSESQAFKHVGLEKKYADIAIASRRINPEEAARLKAAGVGDMYSPLSEHVVALDGLTVYVHPSNPIAGLTLDEVRRIYLHEVADWSEVQGVDADGNPVRGKPGPITLYCGHCRVSSGAYDTIKRMVFNNIDIEFSASYLKILETFEDIQKSIAADPNGIGYSSTIFQSSLSKPLRLSRGGAFFAPDALHIKTGEYPLTHNLYLYTPAKKSPLVAQFVALALSPTGQRMVAQSGLVSPSASGEQTVRQAGAAKQEILNDPKIPVAYKDLIRDADRDETLYNLRFEAGSGQLDNKSLIDLGHLVQTLQEPRNKNATVVLVGFSDSRGDPDVNLKLSVARARFVAEVLKTQGITRVETTGFGEEPALLLNPVESSPEALKDNRRVEVWLKRAP
jgi:phosphate transport system substrate-binding protein